MTLTHASQPLGLEQQWRDRAATLGTAQLETPLWLDLWAALEAVAMGRTRAVSRWVELAEESFLSVWEEYEAGDLLESEITAESVLGHLLLREGIEDWLDALALLRDGLECSDIHRDDILRLAESGQRLLIAVQLFEEESTDCASQFFAAWAN